MILSCIRLWLSHQGVILFIKFSIVETNLYREPNKLFKIKKNMFEQ